MSKKLKFNQPAKLPLPIEKLSLPDNKSCNGRNMIYPGYLEITDKVRFVYHELSKPNLIDHKYYDGFLKEYDASKRTIEVSNDSYANRFNLDNDGKIDSFWIIIKGTKNLLQNNQPCKAKVNDKAEIIELL